MNRPRAVFWKDVRLGLTYYCLTTAVVLVGVAFGHYFLTKPAPAGGENGRFLQCFFRWDGAWYERIARSGYSYDPSRQSSVAFFPAYPLLARSVAELTGLDLRWSLLLITHLCLAGTFILFALHVKDRFPQAPAELAGFVLLAFGLWPTGFFFRMAYTESLFLFLVLLVVHGMHRRWPRWVLGTLVGLLTATRPVGIALTVPLALHLWQRRTPRTRVVGDIVLPAVLCGTGLMAYMLYQQVQFGSAFAFAQTQAHWQIAPPVPWPDRAVALETLQPVWKVFDQTAWDLWTAIDPKAGSPFSAVIMDRVFFLLTAAILVAAAVRRALPPLELLAGGLLLLIPYLSRGYDMDMASMGRFSSVVFPVYVVVGNWLCRLPAALAAGLAAVSASFLVVYTAQFAAGFWFI